MLRGRMWSALAVTLVEGGAIYAWLYLHHHGEPWWGAAALVVGELAELRIINLRVQKNIEKPPVGDPDGAGPHRAKMTRTFLTASASEVAIWLLWLWLFKHWNEIAASALLLVAMHLKHQLETASVRDTTYLTGLWSWIGLTASVSESAGAVGALVLLDRGEPVWAACALAAGLLLEHWLLIGLLFGEIAARDITLPRLKPPPMPRRYRFVDVIDRRFGRVWWCLQHLGRTRLWLNLMGIGQLAKQMPPRPNPLSTMSDYTSWSSLTDRTWSGRHLPPSVSGVSAQPDIDAVANLFVRTGAMNQCPRSTVLFAYFAQWFTDGFLRTQRPGPGRPRDTRRSESTHAVDLAQLYGRSPAMTAALRSGDLGRLRSQMIGVEEFPEYLCHDGRIKRRFRALSYPADLHKLPRRKRDQLFAMGTDTRNLGFVAFNVLFLREHNRVAGMLHTAHPTWDDQRLFETTRNVLIAVLLRIVIADYINHITGAQFKLSLPPPTSFQREPWQRPNWMAIEFNLLYRWHSLVPSTFYLGDRQLTIKQTLSKTTPLTSGGLRAFMLAASEQAAGRIGLFNTDARLVRDAEKPSIVQARLAGLRGYNDYRELCGLPRLSHFGEFSSCPKVSAHLRALYNDSVDDVELYVGLFAEESNPRRTLPPLMAVMVAYDAFTQVLTNPLVAPRIWGPQTFTEIGMNIIEHTNSIGDVVARNVPGSLPGDFVSFTRRNVGSQQAPS